MKKFLLSTVALVGFAGVASAADLPRRAVAPVAPFVPAFTWTGFYFGVNAGAAFDTNSDDDDDFFGDADTVRINRGSIVGSRRSSGVLTLRERGGLFGDDDSSDVGFSGGGQIGFNYQFTPGSGFVVGLEADIQYIDLGGDDNDNGGGFSTRNFSFNADDFRPGRGNNTFGAAFDPRGPRRNSTTGVFGGPAERVVRSGLSVSTLDYFGTVRGRLGYAFDRTLIYATGGFAYGGGETDNNGFDDGIFDDGGDNEFRYGYTVGGGVEFALSSFQLFGSSTATFKIEGLYVNLSEDDDDNNGVRSARYNRVTRTLRLPQNGTGENGDDLEFAVVRAGINFKF